MATISLTAISNGQTGDATVVNNNFTTISTQINGGLDTTNFSSVNTDLSTIAKATAFGTWTSSLTGFSGTPTQDCNYIQIGKIIIAKFDVNGTSNSTSTAFTLPVAAKDSVRAVFIPAIDSGTNLTTPALVVTAASSTTATVYKDGNLSAWTNSGNKAFFGTLVYEAA